MSEGAALTRPVDTSRTDAVLERLSALHPKGFDLSLERIRRLLATLGDPQDRLPPTIHVAGTNGKGSTIAFMRAIAEGAGLEVHVDTSPHLVRWHERFVVAGREVEDARLAEVIERVEAANEGQAITVFELLTAAAFVLFAEAPADLALIEVGLGGRFDSTNVLDRKAVAVVTPIGLDHQQHLGDTLDRIAFEKAGIMREGVPVVLARQEDAAREVLENVARRHGVEPLVGGQDFDAHMERGRLVYQDGFRGGRLLDLAPPGLAGAHQVDNAATAIAAMRVLAHTHGLALSHADYEHGVAGATWPARMQRLRRGPLVERVAPAEVWLDGGHNGHAARALAAHLAGLEERDPRPIVLVAGLLETKEPVEWLEAFAGLVAHVHTVPVPDSQAGRDPGELAAQARDLGIEASAHVGLGEAFETIAARGDTPRVLIAGSLYLAGEVLRDHG